MLFCSTFLTWIAVCEERADGEEDLGDGEGRAPVVLQDVQTDDALAVDVAVVDAGAERHLGRLEGVLRGEVDVQKEDAALVHGPRRAQDGGDPLVDVVALGAGTKTNEIIALSLIQVFGNP